MTLTEAAQLTKKSVYFVGIPLAVIILGWMVFQGFRPPSDLPEKYITPDYLCELNDFGVEPFTLSSLELETTNTTFTVETTSGAIPDLPEVVNVFEYNHPGESLLALQESQLIAEKLKFDKENYTRRSASEYEFQDIYTHRNLVVETGNLNFHLDTDFTNPNVDTYSDRLPSEESAKDIATSFLQKHSFLTQDYKNGYQRTYLIDVTANGELREAPSLSEADLVRVDFFRYKDLITIDPELVGTSEIGATLQQELEQEDTTTVERDSESVEVKKYTTDIMNDSPIFGNISVYLGGTETENTSEHEVFKIDYINWLISNEPCGTYQLITPQEAVRQVQEGEASLVYLAKKNADRIAPYEIKDVANMTILEVDIAYLDRSIKMDYLQPIFVIRGEAEFQDGDYGEFYYYVPAIDYENIPDEVTPRLPEETQKDGEATGTTPQIAQ